TLAVDNGRQGKVDQLGLECVVGVTLTWNRTLAAKKLGMTFRSLRYRLKKFGLDTETEQEV
ncbi:helix-turn-helix domain-containing protein, partial [Acinetobacter baumannii]